MVFLELMNTVGGHISGIYEKGKLVKFNVLTDEDIKGFAKK